MLRSRVIIGHGEGPGLEFRIDGNGGSRRFEMVIAERGMGGLRRRIENSNDWGMGDTDDGVSLSTVGSLKTAYIRAYF